MRVTTALCAALLLLPSWAAAQPRPLVLGSVAMDVPAVMLRRLTPLVQYLSAQLHRPVQLRLSSNLMAATRALAQGRTDIAYLTPVAFLLAQQNAGARALVTPLTRGRPAFRLYLVSRCAGPIRAPSELAGHRFAFGDPAAVLQRAVVVRSGVPMAELRAHYLGHYDNIETGVSVGDFAGGIIKDTLAPSARRQGLCVIYRSPWMPGYVFAVRRGMSVSTASALRTAFLGLRPGTQANTAALAALDPEYTGFAPIRGRNYGIIRTLIRPWWHDVGLHPVSRSGTR